MSLFNQAKQNSFENEVKQIFKTAEQEWMKDSMFETKNIVYARCSEKCSKELQLTGRTNIDYYVEVDKAGNIVKLFATDDTYQYEYKGKGLKIEQIGNSKQIAKLESNDVIKVSCDKIEKNGKNVINIQEKVPVSNAIYWALQDNDGNSINETLIISSRSVSGNKSGSFAGNTSFNSSSDVPWVNSSNIRNSSNLSLNVTTVKVEENVAPTSTSHWFSGVGYASTTFNADLSNLNVSNVINMKEMFISAGSKSTTFNLDLSNWDTSSVTNMSGMFCFASNGSTTFNLNLSSWNTSKVTNMFQMFMLAGSNATTWSIGNISNWDTSNVTIMNGMFREAAYKSTTFNLNLSNWDISSVTDVSNMFSSTGYSATTWSIGDLRNWNTSKILYMNYMFSDAGHSAETWTIGDISNWNTSNVMSMGSMFAYAGYNSPTWSIGDISNWNTSKVSNMAYAFAYAGYSATTFNLDLSNWNTSKVVSLNSMFNNTGYNATTWQITIPKTNGNGIDNTTSRLYGRDSRVYINASKAFTLAS